MPVRRARWSAVERGDEVCAVMALVAERRILLICLEALKQLASGMGRRPPHFE